MGDALATTESFDAQSVPTSDVAYEGWTCPACELEEQLKQAEDELEDVYEENRDLVGQIAELENELALERGIAK